MRDPYEALGLSHDAGEAEIKSAFRKIAKKCHPDVNGGNSQLTEKFRIAAEAYEVLGNPVRKAAYDAYYASGEMTAGESTNSFEKEYMSDIRTDAKATEDKIHYMYRALKEEVKDAIMAFLGGIACLAAGIGLTLGSMFLSDLLNLDHYIVTYGLMIVGVIGAIKNFFVAIYRFIKAISFRIRFWSYI